MLPAPELCLAYSGLLVKGRWGRWVVEAIFTEIYRKYASFIQEREERGISSNKIHQKREHDAKL